jgi:hypothetical protein
MRPHTYSRIRNFVAGIGVYWVAPGANYLWRHPGNPGKNKRSDVMIRTAIISMIASFVLVGAWTVNLVSYHPTTDLNPLAPLSVNWN